MYICYNISLKPSQNEKCFRQKLYRKWRRILCSTIFSRKSCRVWDNIEPGWPQVKISYGACDSCLVTRATDPHSECVILIALSHKKCFRERLGLYLQCLSCLKLLPSGFMYRQCTYVWLTNQAFYTVKMALKPPWNLSVTSNLVPSKLRN
jgi:hypothetical protein